MKTPKSEGDHIRELVDHLGNASDAATALAFYRNRQGWMKISLLLDQIKRQVQELRGH